MKTILNLAVILFIIPAIAFGQSKKEGLNGKTFTIQLTKTSGERKGWQWMTDELSFSTTKLKSKVMKKNEHFNHFNYSSTGDDEGVTLFNAHGKNVGGSEITWSGQINGNTINGTATWQNGQGTQSYTFSGKLK